MSDRATAAAAAIPGTAHWLQKPVPGEAPVKLFLWHKPAQGRAPRGHILFVHGSSMAGTPTFDLDVPGRPDSSAMDWFARQGYATWCLDNEGYGRSDKHRDITFDIACGADDLAIASAHVLAGNGGAPLLVYGISSGALKAAVFAARHPDRVARLALDAFVFTGAGSPTLEQRRRRLPEYEAAGRRRPIDRAFVRSIFERDHPGTAEDAAIEAFASAILALDDSVPIGTYVDMCRNLPVVRPEAILCPTIVMRGEFDGIAALPDLIDFFARLPNPDRQFAVMPGIAHASFQQKNFRIAYHLLASFFAQPAPVYSAHG